MSRNKLYYILVGIEPLTSKIISLLQLNEEKEISDELLKEECEVIISRINGDMFYSLPDHRTLVDFTSEYIGTRFKVQRLRPYSREVSEKDDDGEIAYLISIDLLLCFQNILDSYFSIDGFYMENIEFNYISPFKGLVTYNGYDINKY